MRMMCVCVCAGNRTESSETRSYDFSNAHDGVMTILEKKELAKIFTTCVGSAGFEPKSSPSHARTRRWLVWTPAEAAITDWRKADSWEICCHYSTVHYLKPLRNSLAVHRTCPYPHSEYVPSRYPVTSATSLTTYSSHPTPSPPTTP